MATLPLLVVFICLYPRLASPRLSRRLHPVRRRTTRGNFVMRFIYSQRQILIYGGDTASVRRISRPQQSRTRKTEKKKEKKRRGEKRGRERECTHSRFILGRRERERKERSGGKYVKGERPSCRAHRNSKAYNATIPLMEFL